MGRYILTSEIFDYLGEYQLGGGGEIHLHLIDAIQKLNEVQSFHAYEFDGLRFEVGEKFGFIETMIEFALKWPELTLGCWSCLRRSFRSPLINKK